jgi:hypothetical protein
VFTLLFFVHRVTPIVPALAPAKVLRSGVPMKTSRCSARAPQTAAGVAATVEPSRDTAVETGPQQEEVAAAATSQVQVPRTPSQGRGQAHSESWPAGDREAAGDAADDDAPRLGPIGRPARVSP